MQSSQLMPLVVLAASLLAGCDATDACPQSEVAGLVLQVRDSVTGAGLAPAALITAAEAGAAQVDTLAWIPNADSVFVIGLAGRSGTFTLTVTAPGYQPWQNAALVIDRNACGNTITVEAVALLQPL